MYHIFGTPLNLLDVQEQYIFDRDIAKLRETQRVLIVDDQDFPLEVLLPKYGYRCIHVKDLESFDFVEKYSTVLSDIDGVGQKLGAKHGGALINQIKKTYPMKAIIAYSANTHDADFNQYFHIADGILKKDADVEEWVKLLDQITLENTHPLSQWKKARKLMLEEGVVLENLLRIEDGFVRALKKGKGLEKLNGQVSELNLSNQAAAIVNGLISNLLFKALGGG